ncbi:hypothetical protein Cgig2_028269 [Carnegiea gigantea]|uniref:Uncharacterized protein n=1 Tax=Carnegiea gigantea TaxID=171969 RepID=A0A9Q1GW62_9CARY|nr:hypothetical protein Cgig2_028269 [Carnegiea gigantea]
MNNGCIEQAGVHILMKEVVVDHQVFPKCVDRESSSRASRDMAYEQMSTPAARLRAVEVELEKDRTRTKQSKVNTSWLKAAKNKMIKAFGSWVIDTNVPFTVVDSIYTNPLLETIREVGPDSFNPINLDYIFDDDGLLKLWLSEKEQPVFEGYDLNWLNLDENEVNAAIDVEDDDDPQPDASAPFRYSVDQQPQDMQSSDRNSEENLSPSSSHGGSGGGGDGGDGGANEMGASYSSRRSIDYFSDRDRDRGRGVPLEDDRRSQRSPNEQLSEPTQTYRPIRKGKEPAQPHGYPTDAMYGYTGFQEAPSSFTGPVCLLLQVAMTHMEISPTTMDIMLIALHCLILQMSHNLLGLIQVDNIQITLRSSTRGLLIMRIIIIISPHFIGVIQIRVNNLGWIQQRHLIITSNKSHMVLIRIIMTPIKILPVIHFGGDNLFWILDMGLYLTYNKITTVFYLLWTL